MSEQLATPTIEGRTFTLSADELFRTDAIAFDPAFLEEMTSTAYNVLRDWLEEQKIEQKALLVLDSIVIIGSIQSCAAAGKLNVAGNASLVDAMQSLSRDLVELAGADAWQQHL
jgi:hypothetical protein